MASATSSFIILLSLAVCGIQAFQPVPVSVYYETYCPDSMALVTGQLYPLMQMNNISLNVELKLVPFGKASYTEKDGAYNFTCQHGERECYGNTVHACALKYLSSKKEQLDFINCVMKEIQNNRDQAYPTKQCGEHITGIDQVMSCANGTEGAQLLVRYGQQTSALSPPLTSVPTVVVNNTDRVDSNIKLKSIVCKHLSPLKLSECVDTSGSSPLLSGFLAFVTAALLLAVTHV